MMATATAPRASREILDERWNVATTKPKEYQEPDGSRSTGLDNSEDYYRWEQSVTRIATRLNGDGLNEQELSEVEEIAASIWGETLKDRLLEWAEGRAR
jgi:hypothetical protein